MILLVAIIAAAAATGGVVATKFIVSPAQAAAKTAPPAAGPITVVVDKESLSSVVSTRGDIGAADSTAVTLAAGTGVKGVVTGRVPKVGDQVNKGLVVLEVSGRPVIVLPGAVPGYRDLLPGSTGADVVQLQKALAALGFDSGAADGVYDAGVAGAVDKLYKSLGYSSPVADPGLKTALAAAQQQHDAAVEGLSAVQASLVVAAKGPTSSQTLAADGAVQAAGDSLAKATDTGSPPDQAVVSAAAALQQQAAGPLQQAQAALAAAQTKVPAAPALVNAATQQLQVAQAAADAAAAAAVAAGKPGPPDQGAIRAAQTQLAVARAQRVELLAGPDTTAAKAAVGTAQQLLTTSTQQLAKAQAATLTPLPLSEVLYLASLPQRVDKVTAKIGGSVTDSPISLSGQSLQVTGPVTQAEASLLKVGMAATLTGAAGTSDAVISALTPSQTAGDTSSLLTLTPSKLTVDQQNALRGTNVKVDVRVGATTGAVLTVPIGGLFSDSAGTPRVEVLQADGTTRFQSVRVGLSAQGKAEIHPIGANGKDLAESEKTLQKGSLVVVGR